MIDEVRAQIQDRLDQLLAEVEKLRRALAALGGGERSAPADSARRRPRTRTTHRSAAKATRGRSTVSPSYSDGLEQRRGRSQRQSSCLTWAPAAA
jgi:hypothetical protein